MPEDDHHSSEWARRVVIIARLLRELPLPLEVLTQMVNSALHSEFSLPSVTSATISADIAKLNRQMKDRGIEIKPGSRADLSNDDLNEFKDLNQSFMLTRSKKKAEHTSYKKFLFMTPPEAVIRYEPLNITLDNNALWSCNRITAPAGERPLENHLAAISYAILKQQAMIMTTTEGRFIYDLIQLWWDGLDHHIVVRPTNSTFGLKDIRVTQIISIEKAGANSRVEHDELIKANRFIRWSFRGEGRWDDEKNADTIVISFDKALFPRIIRELGSSETTITDMTHRVKVQFKTLGTAGVLEWIQSLGDKIRLEEPDFLRRKLVSEFLERANRYQSG